MKKIYATLMVALIISLPIYTSSVFASLSSPIMYGENHQIDRYFVTYEGVHVNVTANLQGDDEITASQVRLSGGHLTQEQSFGRCDLLPSAPTSGTHRCTYTIANSRSILDGGTYTISLYNDSGVFKERVSISGHFDDAPPQISRFRVDPTIANSGDISLEYEIQEKANRDSRSICSGLNKLEIHSSDTGLLPEILLHGTPGDCTEINSRTFPIEDLVDSTDTSEREVILTLKAYDNMVGSGTSFDNRPGEETATLTYDITPPTISSLEIEDSTGEEITYVSATPLTGVNVSFEIIDSGLDTNNVYADLTELNIDTPSGYDHMRASCISTDEDEFSCTITNIILKINPGIEGPTTINIPIEAKDIAENPTTTTLTKQITFDIAGPVVTAIETDKKDLDGKSYVTHNTQFIVTISEPSDIDEEDVRLDLSSINSGGGMNNKQADNCTNSGGTHTCVWDGVTTNPGMPDGEKTVTLTATDALGNPATGTLSQVVVVDKTPPRIIPPAYVIPVDVGEQPVIPGIIKTGDMLEVYLNVSERNSIKSATADFSSFSDQGIVDGMFVQEGDKWITGWQGVRVNIPGYIKDYINITITDFANNSATHKEGVRVLNYSGATNVSYWTSEVSCSPTQVDRQITPYVNVIAYCSIKLSPTTGDQETIALNLNTENCVDNIEGSLDYISAVEMYNAERGSTEPYYAIQLEKTEMNIDSLSFTCPLEIISRYGTEVNQVPEVKQIKIDIGFFNMPLGEYGEGIIDDIEDAKDDAFGTVWKIIGFLKMIIKWSRIACQISHTLNKIMVVFSGFTGKITAAAMAAPPPLKPGMEAAKVTACKSELIERKLATKKYIMLGGFCKFINCEMSPPDDKGQVPKKEPKGMFASISNSIGGGEWLNGGYSDFFDWGGAGLSTFAVQIAPPNWIFQFQQRGPPGEKKSGPGWTTGGKISEVFGKKPIEYMNAKDNFFVALVTGCIPGIIYGLEKYRQVLCLYADCLEQNAINNVPPEVCEEQKSYALCKYLTGELFAFIPHIAIFDYYMNMVKGALADPLSAVGILASYTICPLKPCTPGDAASANWLKGWGSCDLLHVLSQIGAIISDVTSIIDSFKKPAADYCERLDDDDDEDDD